MSWTSLEVRWLRWEVQVAHLTWPSNASTRQEPRWIWNLVFNGNEKMVCKQSKRVPGGSFWGVCVYIYIVYLSNVSGKQMKHIFFILQSDLELPPGSFHLIVSGFRLCRAQIFVVERRHRLGGFHLGVFPPWQDCWFEWLWSLGVIWKAKSD